MTRLWADLALGLTGLIWGFGFVAQKDGLNHVGPFTYVAARFLISALVVLPLVFHEKGFGQFKVAILKSKNTVGNILALCAAFGGAVIIQQYGLTATSVTHAAFLTGLYVVMVPFVAFLFYRHKLSTVVVIASLLSFFGVWLLSGGNIHDIENFRFGFGDRLILLCALCFALQVAMMGHTVELVRAPFALSFLQYLMTGIVALVLAVTYEHIRLAALLQAWIPILYAGLASGGIAYTLQAIAQQHTPSSDAAIILSTESLFGGLGGVWLLKERLTPEGMFGCGAIMFAVVLVELGPLLKWGRKLRTRKAAAG